MFFDCTILVSISCGTCPGDFSVQQVKNVLSECLLYRAAKTQLWTLFPYLDLPKFAVIVEVVFIYPLSSSLQNLDALHDHLATIYPGMRAPSFRCTDAEKGKGLILHYYSEREGLQDIVIGIIKTVAQQIHGTEIDMKVIHWRLFWIQMTLVILKMEFWIYLLWLQLMDFTRNMCNPEQWKHQ